MPRRRGGSLNPVRDFSAVSDLFVPYRRVSTREQALKGVSLKAQVKKLKLGFEFKDLRAHSWDDFVDEGKSGKNMKRPGLERALEIVRAGEAGGIAVAKLDRLSRNLLDYSTLMAAAQKEGWNIVILDPDIDLRTPMGKMIAGILALFAEFERDMISQRTLDGLAIKRSEGVQLGRRRTISDELLGAIVGAYFDLGGYSPVARWLNENLVDTPHGGKMWYPSTVSSIVKSNDGKALIESLEIAA